MRKIPGTCCKCSGRIITLVFLQTLGSIGFNLLSQFDDFCKNLFQDVIIGIGCEFFLSLSWALIIDS